MEIIWNIMLYSFKNKIDYYFFFTFVFNYVQCCEYIQNLVNVDKLIFITNKWCYLPQINEVNLAIHCKRISLTLKWQTRLSRDTSSHLRQPTTYIQESSISTLRYFPIYISLKKHTYFLKILQKSFLIWFSPLKAELIRNMFM